MRQWVGLISVLILTLVLLSLNKLSLRLLWLELVRWRAGLIGRHGNVDEGALIHKLAETMIFVVVGNARGQWLTLYSRGSSGRKPVRWLDNTRDRIFRPQAPAFYHPREISEHPLRRASRTTCHSRRVRAMFAQLYRAFEGYQRKIIIAASGPAVSK